jgi:hypothetical protein
MTRERDWAEVLGGICFGERAWRNIGAIVGFSVLGGGMAATAGYMVYMLASNLSPTALGWTAGIGVLAALYIGAASRK